MRDQLAVDTKLARQAAESTVANAIAKANAQMRGHARMHPNLAPHNPHLQFHHPTNTTSPATDSDPSLNSSTPPASSLSSATPKSNDDKSGPVHLSPTQLFKDMKDLLQKKAEQTSRAQNPDFVPKKPAPSMPPQHEMPVVSNPEARLHTHAALQQTAQPDQRVHHPVSQSSAPLSQQFSPPQSSALTAFDVDAATFQLAGTRIDEPEASPITTDTPALATLEVGLVVPSASQDLMPSNMSLSESLAEGIDIHALQFSMDDAKNARKQRADDIDKVLNSAGTSGALSHHCTLSPSFANQMFDSARLNNGKNSASVSRSFSFLFKSGAPFASRENSMDFRKCDLGGGKREMSMDMIRRDISMDLLFSRRIGSQERIDGELVRDMSIDCFGNSLRNTNRDFSMDMQFPTDSNPAQSGAVLELGAFTDDVAFGLPFHGLQQSRADLNSANEGRDAKFPRSKIGMSQDDLMVHVLANQGAHQQYRRNVNGSIEDLRELKMPF